MSNEVFMAREISYNEMLLAEKDGVITALRAENGRLRMALEDIAYPNPLHNEDNLMGIARAALEREGTTD